MKNIAIIFVATVFSNYSISCESVNGTYVTVSETHWNYELTIKGDRATLTYTDHWYGDGETMTESTVVYSGYCEVLSENTYKLKFAGVDTELRYFPELSKEIIGEYAFAPGFISKLMADYEIRLWDSESFAYNK